MSRRRRWVQVLVLGLAAFASIATSKKQGWILEANLARDTPGTSRIAFIEASQEPEVRFDNGEVAKPLASVYTGMWNGTPRYLIPVDRTIASVTIGGSCGGGMCSSGGGCDAPAGAIVKLLSVKPVATWRREVTTPSAIEEVGGDRTEIPVEPSDPVRGHRGRSRPSRHATGRPDRHPLIALSRRAPSGPRGRCGASVRPKRRPTQRSSSASLIG